MGPKPQALGLIVFACTATPLAAEEPLSAIDWLSNSISAPISVAPQSPVLTLQPETRESTISVTPLEAPEGITVGLLAPEVTGFPKRLWASATAEEVRSAIQAVPQELLPALRRLFVTVLLAEAELPKGGDPDDRLFLARIDRLFAMGALNESAALLEQSGAGRPEIFNRWFDAVLLTGNEDAACAALKLRPGLTEDLAARIFCLARGGDWAAAALSLEAGLALGTISEDDGALLIRFLDLDPDGTVQSVTIQGTPTPLEFRMLEAIGEPLPTGPLPTVFAHADMAPSRGWKVRLQSGERLARAGAMGPAPLFALYAEDRPSASGGVWDRATNIQALERAIETDDARNAGLLLPELWEQMQSAGLDSLFAQQYGAALAGLDLEEPAAGLAFQIGLLSDTYEMVADGRTAKTPDEADLIAVALGRARDLPATSGAKASIRDGFAAQAPSPALARMLNDGQVGLAILKAIELFADGAAGDHDRLKDAIVTFRALGLESTARRAALELLLLDRRG